MNYKCLFVLGSALATTACFGQRSIADGRVDQLVEHWRWQQFWTGSTELGASYSPRRHFQALLFWKTDQIPPDLGLCSADLGSCQYYPNLSIMDSNSEMKLNPGEDERSAFLRFFDDSFGQQLLPLARSTERKATDYTAVALQISIPTLDPPEAIQDRKAQPRAETDALVASLVCLRDQPGCRVHLMVPYYGHSDPFVPVFRQCSGCPNPKPMIIFMRLIEGHWWHGAMDFDDSRDGVNRIRGQIEKALMLEVDRP